MAEIYYQNASAALLHRDIMVKVVESLGGMGKIDPYVREMSWTGDLFILSITLTKPVFELECDL